MMTMSWIGMVACLVAYLIPLVLLIVILVKVARIEKRQPRQ
jgi:hypothetical protein